MGGLFGGPKMPAAPAAPPPPPNPATLASSSGMAAADQTQARAASAAGSGFDNTILTSPQGLKTPATTAQKSLLGQ